MTDRAASSVVLSSSGRLLDDRPDAKPDADDLIGYGEHTLAEDREWDEADRQYTLRKEEIE